jgi:hypothetical protein
MPRLVRPEPSACARPSHFSLAGNHFARLHVCAETNWGIVMKFVSHQDGVAHHAVTGRALANATDSVGRFLVYLRDRPLGRELRGSEDLPGSKGALIDAFRLLIAHERRTEQSGQLQKVGLYLAQFRGGERQSSKLGSPDGDEWEQMFAEQEKLEKLFKLSARYARHDSGVYAMSRHGFVNQAHRAHH